MTRVGTDTADLRVHRATELVEAARPWLTSPGEFSRLESGAITVPEPDARQGACG
jgi:hypothetical protein